MPQCTPQSLRRNSKSMKFPEWDQLDKAAAQKLIDRLFHAYFTENRELADKNLLQHIGEECGLDPEKIRGLLDSDHWRYLAKSCGLSRGQIEAMAPAFTGDYCNLKVTSRHGAR